MSTGVSHTFGGTVVVVDMDSGLRFDMSPDLARKNARRCQRAISASHSMLILDALDDRSMRFGGSAEDLEIMARALMSHADLAERQS